MNFSPRQHATLSACLTLAAGALLLLLLVWPALAGRTAFHDRLDVLRLQQQQFNAAAARGPGLKQELAALSGIEIDQSGFLEQKPRDLAAADLQRLLGALVEEAGGSLVSTQVLPDAGNDSIFPEVAIKAHLQGSTGTLQQLLYRFTLNNPLLLMDNLVVQNRRRDEERAKRDSQQLEIRFDVSAFIYQPDRL